MDRFTNFQPSSEDVITYDSVILLFAIITSMVTGCKCGYEPTEILEFFTYTTYPFIADRRPDLQSANLALPSPVYQNPRKRFSTSSGLSPINTFKNLIMPTNRNSRQTSTTNLDRQQEETDTGGTKNYGC